MNIGFGIFLAGVALGLMMGVSFIKSLGIAAISGFLSDGFYSRLKDGA